MPANNQNFLVNGTLKALIAVVLGDGNCGLVSGAGAGAGVALVVDSVLEALVVVDV